MRLQDILDMVREYLGLGIVLVVVVALLLLIGYGVIYKKVCKGKKSIDFKKIFWWLILIFYLFVVLSVTLLRHNGYGVGHIISFFYSYKDAWITASETAWRNIILNILMFVPLGIWLPIGKKGFRAFWKTSLVGCFLTVAIEALQLILSLGLFEVADVFNNTLGTMIGYGFYKILEYFFKLYRKERTKVSHVIVCQIPLVLTVCMFFGIFVAYQKQELGNLSIECISPYSKDSFVIVSDEEYRSDSEAAMVYQTNTLTVEETEEVARTFFENLGTTLDESRNDIYEDTAVYWAEDSYNMWIDYKGGTYHMTDFDTSFPEESGEQPQPVADATEEEILKALSEYGIDIPAGASFANVSDGEYKFTVDRIEVNGMVYDGELTCDYYDNGKFADIRNDIKKFEVYKEFEIRSEQDAYDQILEGKFVCAISLGEKIEIGQVTLDYMLDTKGFYQPIYMFEVSVSGEEQRILIPAIKK